MAIRTGSIIFLHTHSIRESLERATNNWEYVCRNEEKYERMDKNRRHACLARHEDSAAPRRESQENTGREENKEEGEEPEHFFYI